MEKEESQSKFERDRDVAREWYPRAMERLEMLRADLDDDFDAAVFLFLEQGHLVRWSDGSHSLVYDAGASPVSMRLRLDFEEKQITDIGIGGSISCPDFVEVRYDRKESSSPANSPTQVSGEQQGSRTKVPHGYFEPLAYWGVGDYHGDPPTIPPGAHAVRVPARRAAG